MTAYTGIRYEGSLFWDNVEKIRIELELPGFTDDEEDLMERAWNAALEAAAAKMIEADYYCGKGAANEIRKLKE